ncbi:hypothetical protein EAE96_007702 [Botrytis aclada]|nr:hypothetical protein EAE96_007702 [Botrytis aclada]
MFICILSLWIVPTNFAIGFQTIWKAKDLWLSSNTMLDTSHALKSSTKTAVAPPSFSPVSPLDSSYSTSPVIATNL